MHLADAFIQSDLVQSGYNFFYQYVFPGNWTHDLLHCLMQCSTTEPQEQHIINFSHK